MSGYDLFAKRGYSLVEPVDCLLSGTSYRFCVIGPGSIDAIDDDPRCKWCRENVRSFFAYENRQHSPDYELVNSKILKVFPREFFFVSDSDAIAFKMRWG